MKTQRLAITTLALVAILSVGIAQQSDYEIKERFKHTYDALKADIDSTKTKEQMSQISNRIDGLETEFAEDSALLGGAFYPKTFHGMMAELRDQFALTQEKNTTIQTQGERITELESELTILTARPCRP